MKNALIIHGAYGAPNENWIPWLQTELEKQGYEVVVPTFPTPEGQNLENWMRVIDQVDFDFNDQTVLVGHSIGATFLLSLLEKYQVKKTVLVSGFVSDLSTPNFDNSEFDIINQTFYEKEFDWVTIQNNAGAITMFHGSDDPYVSFSHAHTLGEKLHSNPIVIADGGHLNESAGFTEFQMLLDTVLE